MNMNPYRTWPLITLLTVLPLLAPLPATADVMRPPHVKPVEKNLAGKLAWTYAARADGKEQKNTLILRTADQHDIVLGQAGRLSLPPGVDVEKLLGKQVIVTVMAEAVPDIQIKRIKSIKQEPVSL